MNLVVLKGRLARAPEVRTTGSGKSVVDFTIACDAGKKKRPSGGFYLLHGVGQDGSLMESGSRKARRYY